MQKWEFLHVISNSEKSRSIPRFVDGVELRDWKNGVDIAQYANQLGEQGWELVNAQQLSYGTYHYWFKRPKP